MVGESHPKNNHLSRSVIIMNKEQLKRMGEAQGFIAALDQSGGSTPKALEAYGVLGTAFSNDEEMYNCVHEMRTRIITCPSFDAEHILAAILFEDTMNKKIEGQYTADYLWDVKGIVPMLKVDLGLEPMENGVQLMKPLEEHLKTLLVRAKERNIFGTKMRSVIHEPNEEGIRALVAQQFEIARVILAAGFMPIIEPEVNINGPQKAECEALLNKVILETLAEEAEGVQYMFKVTLPEVVNLYADLIANPHALRVVALSGGYTRKEANRRLSENHGMIASFSRGLSEGLNAHQSDIEFKHTMKDTIQGIYDASIL